MMEVSIWISDPDGMNLSGTVQVKVTASPITNLKGVELYIDDVLVRQSTSSPIDYQWNTTTASDGTHKLRGDAVYKKRRSTSQIAVTVNNAAPPPPPPPPPSWPASYFTGPLGQNNVVPASTNGALLVEYFGIGEPGVTYSQSRALLLQRAADCGRTHFDGVGIHYGGPYTPSATQNINGPQPEAWAHANGMIPVVSWSTGRVSGTANLMLEINQGLHDSKFQTALTYWKSLGARVIWRPFHEFNGNWFNWSPVANAAIGNPGCTPAQWVQAWRRIVDLSKSLGVTNVGFGWSPSEGQDRTLRTNCYPGDAYVDWVMPDGYNHDGGGSGTTWSTPLHGYWAEFREMFDYTNMGSAALSTYSQYAGSKPFVPGETATKYDAADRPAGHVVDPNRKANWYRNIASVARPNMPNLCGLCVFDQWVSSEGNDWRVESNQPPTTKNKGSSDALTYQGFKDFAADPAWNVGVT